MVPTLASVYAVGRLKWRGYQRHIFGAVFGSRVIWMEAESPEIGGNKPFAGVAQVASLASGLEHCWLNGTRIGRIS